LAKHYTTDLSGLGLNQDYNTIVAYLKKQIEGGVLEMAFSSKGIDQMLFPNGVSDT
jgi:hypothetical protein